MGKSNATVWVRAWAVVYDDNTHVDPESIRYQRVETERYLNYRIAGLIASGIKARIVCIHIPKVRPKKTTKKKARRA